MTFSEAMEALKNGERVARSGWNGKKMWICMTGGSVIPLSAALTGAASALAIEAEANGLSEIRLNAHIDMRAADGSLTIGWLASQTDMLADDWHVVT